MTEAVRCDRRTSVALLAAAVLTGCSWTPASDDDPSSTSRTAQGPPASSIHAVVLGDSIATTNGCTACTGFPDLYARAIGRRTGSEVDVANLAVPDTGVADLLTQVREDEFTKQQLAEADVVVVSIGFNDTPWGRGDDPCQVAPRFPVVAWDKITDSCIERVSEEYAERLEAVLASVGRTVPTDSSLRVVGLYNSVIGDHVDPTWDSPEAVTPSVNGNAAFVAAQREATARHGGVFVDMGTRMNGRQGRRDAATYLAGDFTHLNQRGHALTARALTYSGWEE